MWCTAPSSSFRTSALPSASPSALPAFQVQTPPSFVAVDDTVYSTVMCAEFIAAGLVEDLHLYRADPEDVREKERAKRRKNPSNKGALYTSKRAKRGLFLSFFNSYQVV